MRAIKRVLNVKNFFLLAFFKIRTFFFFKNSLFFVLCLNPSRVEILPKLLGACEADTHLAGKWAFLEWVVSLSPLWPTILVTQSLLEDKMDISVPVYWLLSWDRFLNSWPTQCSPWAWRVAWLVACYRFPAPKAFLSEEGLRMDLCPELCTLLSQDQRLAQLWWTTSWGDNWGHLGLAEHLDSPSLRFPPSLWGSGMLKSSPGDGSSPQTMTARGKQIFCIASLLSLADWDTNSVLPRGSGGMIMPAIPKASASLAAWLWKSFEEETWALTAQTSP